MPPRKKTAPAAPAKPALDGCVVALSGAFPGQSQSILESYLTSLGAAFSKTVAKSVTHLITTTDDFKKPSAKVQQAQKKGLPIVSLEWAQECERKKSLVPTDDFAFDDADEDDDQGNDNSPAPTKPAAKLSQQNGTQNTATQNGVKSRKRAIAAVSADAGKNGAAADAEPESKKKKPNGDSAPAKKPKETVAEGQIAKRKDVQIPVDEECTLSNYVVYIDDQGMIFDATLNQANASHNNNKFYRVQVRTNTSPASAGYY
jgi:poly [ADP-ribose] polymerase 2/3/4